MNTSSLRLLVAGAAFVTMTLLPFSLMAQSAPAPNSANPTTSAAAARAVTVPAKNGVELKATINGQGPFDAVFDTGSGNLMTASLAKRLGLKLEGSATINAGGGNVPAKVVKVATINIGGLTMSDQLFAVVDTPLTQDQDGIFVGDLLLQNLPIRIDFEKQEITFYSKAGICNTRATEPRSPSIHRTAVFSPRPPWTALTACSGSTRGHVLPVAVCSVC